MEKFDVRIVSKDIIDGAPFATCVVTHNAQYLSTVRYNYFSEEATAIHLETTCIPPAERTLHFIEEMTNQICLSVLHFINSETNSAVNRMTNIINCKNSNS